MKLEYKCANFWQMESHIEGVAMAEWSEASDWELRSRVVGSNPNRPCQQFFYTVLQKNQQGTLSQGNSNLQTSNSGTLIKVLVMHQHSLSLYCTRWLLFYEGTLKWYIKVSWWNPWQKSLPNRIKQWHVWSLILFMGQTIWHKTIKYLQ